MKLKQKIKVADIAKQFNGKLIGKQDAEIGSINEIHKLENDSLTFVDNEKYYNKVIASKAIAILIDKETPCPPEKTLIIVENPFDVYNQLAKKVQPFTPSEKYISESAQIGVYTKIQPGVFIGNNVKIGNHCIIHSNVSIYDNVVIGNGVIIHANTSVGGDAFYYHKSQLDKYEKMHTIGHVEIEDDVEIGSCCNIDKGVSGVTKIGKGTKLDSLVHIAHGVVIGKNCLLCSQVAIAGKSEIKNGVVLYGKVGVNKDITIGENAVVLAASNVANSLEANKTYFGSPAMLAKQKWRELVYLKKLPELFKKL